MSQDRGRLPGGVVVTVGMPGDCGLFAAVGTQIVYAIKLTLISGLLAGAFGSYLSTGTHGQDRYPVERVGEGGVGAPPVTRHARDLRGNKNREGR